MILHHVRVTNGSALSGRGVANRNASMVITSSLIDHNQALTGGGAATATATATGSSTDLPVLVRDAMLAIPASRGGLWLWLAAQRTVTAVAIERALRRELRSRARLPPR